jgi:hypothetical protein
MTPLDRIMAEQGRRSDWLARTANVSTSLVRFWRLGQRSISERHLPIVAGALGVEPDDLRYD